MNIKNNISAIRKIVGNEVKIIAVTKNRSISEIEEVIEAGITDIGESRLQEAKDKFHDSVLSSWSKDKMHKTQIFQKIIKHFIGRLQTNKVSEVVRLFDVIQSVDSLKLAEKISQECGKIGKIMPILIQVNTSGESQKGGVDTYSLDSFIERVSELPNIRVEGLMTIAIDSSDTNEVRECFKKLNEKFQNAKCESEMRNLKCEMLWLSMGMSGDYKIAVEEGANMVRIGGGIFRNF